MQENLQPGDAEKQAADEISIKKVILQFGNNRRYLFSKWKLLFIAALVGAIAGFIYVIEKKISYTAECTFVMEEEEKGSAGLGQYSGLAAMAGIDMPGNSDLFQGDNISQLYKSRLMLEKTLLSPADSNSKSDLLIDRYIDLNNYRKAWSNNPGLKDINFAIPRNQFTIKQDSLVTAFIADINKNYLTVDKPDKKLSMISVKVKSHDQLFSKAFTESIVANVNSFYIQTKTKHALDNVLLLQHQADSVHRILNSSIGSAASASDSNPDPDPAQQQVLRVPAQRRQVEVQASTAIYAEVIRNLEIAKASLQRETPLIQVIDQPILPLANDRSGKLLSMINGALIAIAVAIVLIFTLKIYRAIMS